MEWLLPAIDQRYHVLVVDNGSDDGSAQVAAALGATVVHCRKRGYGIAVQTGFTHILASQSPDTACTVVILDADGSSPLSAIPLLIADIQKGADLVIAQRTTLERDAMPAHARFGNWLQTSLIYQLTGRAYLDMGPLRALNLAAYRALEMQDQTWGWNVEMQIKSALYGLQVSEIPITYHARKHGHSKISGTFVGSIRAGIRILYSVVFYYTVARCKRAKARRHLDNKSKAGGRNSGWFRQGGHQL